MTEIIEDQTLRLSQMTTRLLRIARLDRDDVRPLMERSSLRAPAPAMKPSTGNDRS